METFKKDLTRSEYFYSNFHPIRNNYITPEFKKFLLNYEIYMNEIFDENIYNYEEVKEILYNKSDELRVLDESLYYEMCEKSIEYEKYKSERLGGYHKAIDDIQYGNHSRQIIELSKLDHYDAVVSEVEFRDNVLVLELDNYIQKIRYVFKIKKLISNISWKSLKGCHIFREELLYYSESKLFEYNVCVVDNKKIHHEVSLVFYEITSRICKQVDSTEIPTSEMKYDILIKFDSLNYQNFDGIVFWKLDLSSLNFRGSSFICSNFRDSNMRVCDLSHCELSNAFLYNVNLLGANLRLAELKNIKASASCFQQVDLYGTSLVASQFISSNFCDANFENVDLRETKFLNSILHGANLNGKNLRDSSFEGSMFDETTIWPEGFNAPSKGARLVPRETAEWLHKLNGSFPLRIREEAIGYLSTMSPQYCDLLINDSMNRYESISKVMENLGYPKNKKAVIKLLYSNLKWWENLIFFKILKDIADKDKVFLVSLIEDVVVELYNKKAGFELFRILKYFCKYGQIFEDDFNNKEIFKSITM